MADREKEEAYSGDLPPEGNADQPQQEADENVEDEVANIAANILQNLNVNPDDIEVIVEIEEGEDDDNKDSGAETDDEGTAEGGDSLSAENSNNGYVMIQELRDIRLDSRVILLVDEQLLDPQTIMQFARYEQTDDEESESEEQNEESGERGNAKSGELASVEEALR